MMRLAAIIFVFICTLAVPVLAETISVRSGAHSGFTRLVLEFSEPHEWRFGPVAGGLEFRTDAADISFDLADVFSRITGQRIASLSQPGPGRLLFGLGCNCHGDAFVIGANQIVLDIKDGGGAAGAEFSMRLSELPAGRTWGQTTAPAADGPATRAPRGLVPELGGVLCRSGQIRIQCAVFEPARWTTARARRRQTARAAAASRGGHTGIGCAGRGRDADRKRTTPTACIGCAGPERAATTCNSRAECKRACDTANASRRYARNIGRDAKCRARKTARKDHATFNR